MKSRILLAGAASVAIASATWASFAADHIDSPKAVDEPSADINDLYAWMNDDATKLNLVLDVMPFAEEGAQFSDATQYVFHVNSSEGYGMAQTETQILCQFYAAGMIECWAGDEYVTGDPSATAGITSESGMLRVFAGLRNDPFFFELDGFRETVKAVVAAAPDLTFDDDGCPDVDDATSATLVGQLMSGVDGAAASDTFAGANVLSIVVQIDKTLVTGGGPMLGVWASTHRAN